MKKSQLNPSDFTNAARKVITKGDYKKLLMNLVEIASYKGNDPKLAMAAVRAFELLHKAAGKPKILGGGEV